MHNLQYLSTGFFLLLALSSCKSETHEPFIKDSNPPGRILITHVKNLPGTATIFYKLPKGTDILYVEADYEIRRGVEKKVKSSFYDNSITVEGFSDTSEYTVQLYTVNRSEKKSPPHYCKGKAVNTPSLECF